MLNYSLFKNKIPEIIVNIPGEIICDNKQSLNFNLEIDYNKFDALKIEKITKELKEEFKEKTSTSTIIDGKKFDGTYVPIINNNKKEYYKIRTENSLKNFKFIKIKVEILSKEKLLHTIETSHSKSLRNIRLDDGDYNFKFYIYNTDSELIKTSDTRVLLKTNSYSLKNNVSGNNEIVFDKNEGDFRIKIAPKSNRYYTFEVTDIISINDNIFEVKIWEKNSNSKATIGKVGAELKILSDTQIKEYEEKSYLADEIEGKFLFNVREILTSEEKENSLARIRIPTLKSKIKDNLKKYNNVKCDVTQGYETTVKYNEKLLITDKFKNEPLFYKFIVDESIEDFVIKDENGNDIKNYIIDKLSKDLNVIYFSPKKNINYYYKNKDYPYTTISYKKSYESFIVEFENECNLGEGFYFDNLIIKSKEEKPVDIKVTFSDYTEKEISKCISVSSGTDMRFLPNDRMKVSKDIRNIEFKDKDISIVNMICNSKKIK
ncbi:hypothetical protein, partial [uncultured Cetobacterium sp.]|uniref:hypothetical protein n=1 Tax=uncultured Cetobacterium sp. TaxID=527638 RepID=UPI002615A41D